MKVVVTGSIAFDYLMHFPGKFEEHILPDKIAHLSVSFLVDRLHKRSGGTAANIAYSLALLGEKPLLVGAVGEDCDAYLKDLKSRGVDIRGVRVFTEAHTSSFFCNTDKEGNQIASFYTGAMKFARTLSLQDFTIPAKALVIVSPNDPEAMIRFARECRHRRTPFIFDPGQQVVDLSPEAILEGADGACCMIVNEYEMDMISRKTGLSEKALLEKSEVIIVTLGKKGSRITTAKGRIKVPVAEPERVADPTGVGDAYRAGLVKGMLCGLPWEIAGRMGSLAAAYVLETDGPQGHSYTWKDFVKRYESQFGRQARLRKIE